MESTEAILMPIDGTTRDAMLATLLREHPDALVSAIDVGGVFVPMPPTLQLNGQKVAAAVSALSLVDAASRAPIVDAWGEVRTLGASRTSVVLSSGASATYHFIDVRHRHGVLVGVLVPDVPGEMTIGFAMRVLTDADGAPAGAVLCIDDVTEAANLRTDLERRATIDELTGCFNRAAVLNSLDDTLRRHGRGSFGTAAVFLDLDGFKEVNDTFGHKAGDDLLAGAALRLRGGMRGGDVIGRLGGDEFIVVFANVVDANEAMRIARRLSDTLSAPVEVVPGLPVRIRCSIGVAWTAGVDVDGDTLTAAADRAMYESKRAGVCEPVLVTV